MIIDGKQIASSIRAGIRQDVLRLSAQGRRVPSLKVILLGENLASMSYVRGKIRAAEEVGINSELVHLPDTCTEADLLGMISKFNSDIDVDGILVQLPLPSHINENRLLKAISPQKDVDGFHPENVARLWLGEPCVQPCTPRGIIAMLDACGIEIAGKEAVVVGRSNIVGKPVAKLLLDRQATVTIAHSHTANLAAVTARADILVSAVGVPRLITARHVKKGAVVIDVGITRVDGHLTGDVDFDEVREVASAITPVPGGVGPLTITMLMQNTLDCYRMKM
ncbi:MAG: bifunctional methylenetetrahydrofolate dehydrogenase/methenyltetrahydrofolate cyclohydrolase FolD [Paludibacteraceae bacterium]|nr:bifunctional methylenetetrahydrofolate dehydrogenase/methenyltetrahydrofolate cyclohydrolase FolD [Paludibacteraceae bacterium]